MGAKKLTFRRILFWFHLVLGLGAGLLILLMALTGFILAFEHQVVDLSQRNLAEVASTGQPRLSLDELREKATDAASGRITGLTLKNEPEAAVAFMQGREKTIWVNPYTGEVFGASPTGAEKFFHFVEELHRWLALSGKNRDVGKNVLGVATCIFGLLIVSGLYLWFPKVWTKENFRSVTVLNLEAKGKTRDWNWHNVIGFWTLPLLLILVVTGLMIKYTWASNLIYQLTGSPVPPAQRQRAGGGGERGEGRDVAMASLDGFFDAAQKQAPHWRMMSFRFPMRENAHLSITLEEADSWHPHPRSTLTFNSNTAEVTKWEPYDQQPLAQQIRGWVRPLHVGEVGGILGQLLAAVASLGAVLLVWTGFALSWRRFFGKAKPTPSPV